MPILDRHVDLVMQFIDKIGLNGHELKNRMQGNTRDGFAFINSSEFFMDIFFIISNNDTEYIQPWMFKDFAIFL